MPKRKWPAATLAGLLFVALLAGLAYLSGITTEDSYPEMSSLNSGPKGAKLLFDSLASIPALAVSRNYLPSGQWHPAKTTVLVFSLRAMAVNDFDKRDLAEIEQLTRGNNRVVLGIKDESPVTKPDPKKPFLVQTRWGIRVLQEEKKSKDDEPELILDHDGSWQPVAGLDDALEKHFGKEGSVVVALHSEDFSNESVATDESVLEEIPALIGRRKAVAFDETHLGIEESGSIAALARRFKLEGLIAGLVLLVGLFIWNQSVSFPPPSRFESQRDKQVLGADARGMFANLIARHLTPQALVESCISEWNRVKPQQRITADPADKSDAVAAYRQLQESLQKKRSRI